MSLLAPSIAAAFLGCLAFVAWLLHFRRETGGLQREIGALRTKLSEAAAIAQAHGDAAAILRRDLDQLCEGHNKLANAFGAKALGQEFGA